MAMARIRSFDGIPELSAFCEEFHIDVGIAQLGHFAARMVETAVITAQRLGDDRKLEILDALRVWKQENQGASVNRVEAALGCGVDTKNPAENGFFTWHTRNDPEIEFTGAKSAILTVRRLTNGHTAA
jgi:hypothetical protein